MFVVHGYKGRTSQCPAYMNFVNAYRVECDFVDTMETEQNGNLFFLSFLSGLTGLDITTLARPLI